MMQQTPTSPTFYWYDYETFGLDARRDLPAQFAGRRTTLDLDPVPGPQGKGEILYCRPSRDRLPSPESCMLTGITPQFCEENGLTESDFAGEVFERLNTPETISIGYNTLGFDDEVNRFLFWRNFLDAYTHGWRNGCSRWDLFPLVCATWALRGDTIRWPQWEEIDPVRYPKAAGRKGVCFKLEFLSKANGIEHGHAHDALSDVEATIGLARLIREREPRLWKWALENRTPQKVHAAVADMKPVVWVTPRFGIDHGCTGIVAVLRQEDKHAFWMWDLTKDPEVLRILSLEELRRRMRPSRDEWAAMKAEGIERLPLRKLKANASPFVCADLRVLSRERAARYGIDLSVVGENLAKLRELAPVVQGALAEVLRHDADEGAADVDTSLYASGFPSPADRARFEQIRSAAPEELRAAAQKGVRFDDPQFKELFLRFRARNRPETLTPEEAQYWQSFCRRRILEGAEGALAVSDYFEQIDALQEGLENQVREGDGSIDESREAVLEALYAWGEELGDALSD